MDDEEYYMEGLSSCELMIMKLIWSREEELVLHQIVAMANETYGRDWNPNTVSTFLSRLVRKGYIAGYKKSRYYFYHIIITEEAYKAQQIDKQIELWNNGSVCDYVCDILESMKLTQEDFDKIEKALKNMAS